jgi:hypothetical protein
LPRRNVYRLLLRDYPQILRNRQADCEADILSLEPWDAVQLAASLVGKTGAFITNDLKLRKVQETRIIILRDYL